VGSTSASQLQHYVDHITFHFDDYKRSYETAFQQKRNLGLITVPEYDQIEIVKPVMGIVVVGGYSGIANIQIEELKRAFPRIRIKQFIYAM